MAWTDIGQLVELETVLFPQDAWAAPTWWAELAARPRRDYLVEDEDGRVLAYAGVDHGGDVADLMTIAVAPAGQGRGLGRVLLGEVVARARAGGASSLMLEVRADNEPARNLYDSNGFETVRVRRRYYQPGDEDALVMRLALDAGAADEGPVVRA